MLAVFLPPYPFRGVKAPYLWFFYKYLHCAKNKFFFITGEDYLNIQNTNEKLHRWEFEPATMESLGYDIPNDDVFKQHEYGFLNSSLYEQLLSENNNDPLRLFSLFLTERIPEIEEEIFSLLKKKSVALDQIDAFISICNCPSLEHVANSVGKKVVHVEIGPLRAPMYLNTAYFDFSGVNGGTEAFIRYNKCNEPLKVDASVKDLQQYFLESIQPQSQDEVSSAGVVLQVEDDSNLIAYNNNFTNVSLISAVRQNYNYDDMLVRPHPGSLFSLQSNLFRIDNSENSLQFIEKCNEIFTINSSVGLETILCEKKLTILGDCSYSFINEYDKDEEKVNALAFYLFSYLVPFSFIFDQEYILFRLSEPEEKEIALKNISFYSGKRSDKQTGDVYTLSSLINEEVSQDKSMRKILEKSLEESNQQIELLKNQLLMESVEKQKILAESIEREKINSENAERERLESESLALERTNLEISEREKILAELEKLKSDLQSTSTTTNSLSLELEHKIKEINELRDSLSAELEYKRKEINALRNSLSWRLTIPLRMLGRLLRGELVTIKAMFREYFHSGNSGVSRFLISAGGVFTSKAKYKTAMRLVFSGNWRGVSEGLNRVIHRTKNDSMPTSAIFDSNMVFILATQHTLYVANLLKRNFNDNGISAIVTTDYLQEQDLGQMYVVVCPQMFPVLPKNYIAYQMEQSVNPRWFTEEYFTRLNSAIAIFDYSLKNIEYLLQQGIPYQKLFYMPVSSYFGYYNFLGLGDHFLKNKSEQPSVLFYGDPNCERRKNYINELKKHFNITIASEVFGDELLRLVKSAKIVVNIHYYENALLETTRLYETLSLGTPIVSESSSDIDEHKGLQDIIDFCPVGDISSMVNKINNLLSNEEQYQNKKKQIINFTQQDIRSNFYLKRYLLSIEKITFSQYQSDFSFDDISENDIPRLCLSLSETPERKKHFFEKPYHDFVFFEGLRYRIGWIGCGMSYKYMLTQMLTSKAQMGIICEDDVLFPTNYDSQIQKIIKYLKQTDVKWHIFAGIIAHLHEDTKVIDVEEIDGIEYVYIDKMTSMVMNIYSRSGMELISQWNEKDINAETNTIDRYVESAQDLIVVTTLPFLVGYAEEQQSTLWGFKNSQYTSLIQASELLLRNKVAEFKRKNI